MNLAEQLAALSEEEAVALIGSMEPSEIIATVYDLTLWSMAHQQFPPGDWRVWVMRGGRGSGKTHGGASATHQVAMDRSKIKRGQIGIVARTFTEARRIMIEGVSGILNVAPPHERPTWSPAKQELVWPNGVVGIVCTGDKPETMRGPNFAWVWCDECAYYPNIRQTWTEALMPALREGWARCLVTSTPTRHGFLKWLEDQPGTVTTRAKMMDNPHLPSGPRKALADAYAGTRAGKVELDGEHPEGSSQLFTQGVIATHRVVAMPKLRRVVVAVDPAGGDDDDPAKETDECGIVVAGIDTSDPPHVYIMRDDSCSGDPKIWAPKCAASYNRAEADCMPAEKNYGGKMVADLILHEDPDINVKPVWASSSKYDRAEPVAALYEKGRIHHVGIHHALEYEITNWRPGDKSPNRMDALVYACIELFWPDDDDEIFDFIFPH